MLPRGRGTAAASPVGRAASCAIPRDAARPRRQGPQGPGAGPRRCGALSTLKGRKPNQGLPGRSAWAASRHCGRYRRSPWCGQQQHGRIREPGDQNSTHRTTARRRSATARRLLSTYAPYSSAAKRTRDGRVVEEANVSRDGVGPAGREPLPIDCRPLDRRRRPGAPPAAGGRVDDAPGARRGRSAASAAGAPRRPRPLARGRPAVAVQQQRGVELGPAAARPGRGRAARRADRRAAPRTSRERRGRPRPPARVRPAV